jgi:hypothetical protein
MLLAIEGVESVSVHLRRGDYVSHKIASEYLGALPLSYYRGAAEHLSSQLQDPIFFIFSDSPEWARQNLQLPFVTRFVPHVSDDPAWEMQLMSTCRHSIIANSSFSWWGAWLGAADDRIVIAPKHWFRDPAIDTSDLIPARWHRI